MSVWVCCVFVCVCVSHAQQIFDRYGAVLFRAREVQNTMEQPNVDDVTQQVHLRHMIDVHEFTELMNSFGRHVSRFAMSERIGRYCKLGVSRKKNQNHFLSVQL